MAVRTKRLERFNTSARGLKKVASFGRLFSQREAGSATTEYAFLLAMIVGGILVAVQLLSHTTGKAFESVTVAIGKADSPTSGSAATQSPSPDRSPSQPALATPTSWNSHLAMAQAASFIIIIGLWLVMRREMRSERTNVKESTEGEGGSLSGERQQRLFVKRQEILKILSSEMDALMNSRLEVGHLMSDTLRIVSPSTSVQDVATTMKCNHVRHLLVCDKDKKLLGIISDRDLHKTEANSAQELMTPQPLCAGRHDLVSPAVTMMVKECISALPVVEDDRVVGMLTSTDLMMALQCSMQILQKVAFIVSPSQVQDLEEGVLAC